MRSIFVGMPVYAGDVGVGTMQSLLLAFEEAKQGGWGLQASDVYCRVGDADIAAARNVLVGKFLTSDCSHLLFMDADLSFEAGAFTRFISHEVDFVAAAYRIKSDEREHYPILWPEQRRMSLGKGGHPLLAVEGIAGGLWLLSRACLESMAEANKDVYFYDDNLPGVKCPWLFEFEFDKKNKIRRSEDFSFCQHWRELGGEVWCDPTINVNHKGSKVYEGSLGSYLQRQVRDDKSNLDRAFEYGGNDVLEMAKRELRLAQCA
jgi:hypothetical protein